MAKRKKQGNMKEKNRLRLRRLWPHMTEPERRALCQRTFSNHLLSVGMWERPWDGLSAFWQSALGTAGLLRRDALRIADRIPCR